METIESGRHLFQPPKYSPDKINWDGDFFKTLGSLSETLTWDLSSIAAILSCSYTTGDRTLLQEISRMPWLSSADGKGAIHCEPIPPHGLYWDSSQNIAKKLFDLLLQEAEDVCKNRKEIYLLLSGGLDSRIVAGVLGHLYKSGRISRPISVTWGLEKSRDVSYARAIAKILGFDWQHITIGPKNIRENLYEGFTQIAGLVSPIHLHAMLWFRNVSPDALVLAGSYGDSIGRAEFSGRHLLELDYLRLDVPFGLLSKNVLPIAQGQIMKDSQVLHQRTVGNAPKYVICEHQMQGFYMRNLIGTAMSLINQFCTMYQMFTAPEVYGYIWSLHPARRDDSIYASLLEIVNPDLARLPWARTNRALCGKTVGADPTLQKEFHNYAEWCSGPLYAEISTLLDPNWFEETGMYNSQGIRFLNESLKPGCSKLKCLGMRPYHIWLWLAGFRVFVEKVQKAGKTISVPVGSHDEPSSVVSCKDSRSKLRIFFSNNRVLYKTISKTRRWVYKRIAIRSMPPRYIS